MIIPIPLALVPTPTLPVTVNDGLVVYPEPPLTIDTTPIDPMVVIPAVAAAPTPVPSGSWIVTIGASVYPEPAFDKLIATIFPSVSPVSQSTNVLDIDAIPTADIPPSGADDIPIKGWGEVLYPVPTFLIVILSTAPVET